MIGCARMLQKVAKKKRQMRSSLSPADCACPCHLGVRPVHAVPCCGFAYHIMPRAILRKLKKKKAAAPKRKRP